MFGKWRNKQQASREVSVEVSEKDGIRSLHLGSDTVQSSMKLADPDGLVLSYTRAMMAFLLFRPRSERFLMIGLGGGSLPKFVYRRLPWSRTIVIESNAQVIVAARQYFHVPENDERFLVEHADGAAWVAEHPHSCDVLMVDGYDGRDQAQGLASEKFYFDAQSALGPDGVLVVNLWSSDARFEDCLAALRATFTAVVCVPAVRRGNVAVLAFSRALEEPKWDDLRTCARSLQTLYGLEFLQFVEGMRESNQRSASRLLA
ncbi:MAG: polyamine aminopropyltransferase [Burkholderiales bacterium]